MSTDEMHVIYLKDAADSVSRRPGARSAHLAYIAANAHRVVFAGPLLDGDRPCGGVIVLRGSHAEAERFMADDPFTAAGVHGTMEITRFRLAALPAPPAG